MIENVTPYQTRTPWTGETVEGVYLPGEEEVWQRAAELRAMRSNPSDQGGPTLCVTISGKEAEIKAREASKFVGNKRE